MENYVDKIKKGTDEYEIRDTVARQMIAGVEEALEEL